MEKPLRGARAHRPLTAVSKKNGGREPPSRAPSRRGGKAPKATAGGRNKLPCGLGLGAQEGALLPSVFVPATQN